MSDNPSICLTGPLADPDLLYLVLGEDVAGRPGVLLGHSQNRSVGTIATGLVPCDGASTPCLMVSDLSADASDRMAFFQSCLGAQTCDVRVQTGAEPRPARAWSAPCNTAADPWDAGQWQARDAATDLALTQEIMERYGTNNPDQIRPILPHLRARAWAQVQARAHPHPVTRRRRAMPGDIQEMRHNGGHEGFFRLKSFSHRTRQFDGTLGPEVQRECFLAFDASLVVPYDPVRDLVLLVEQFRYGPFWRGDPEYFVLEPVAGLIDAGESPEQSAHREAREEAGVTLNDLIKVGAHYPAPGYVTEFYHCFIGLCDLDPSMAGIGGLESESENIRSHILEFGAAMDLLESGEISTLPLAMILMDLRHRRDGLRAAT